MKIYWFSRYRVYVHCPQGASIYMNTCMYMYIRSMYMSLYTCTCVHNYTKLQYLTSIFSSES